MLLWQSMHNRFFTRLLQFALALSTLVLGASVATAASLQISPVGLSLSAKQQAGAFTLGNVGNAPLTAQVRVFRWRQNEQGEDILKPTNALVISPPMVQIAPKGKQQFRVMRTQAAGEKEEAYRLIVDELPPPANKPKKGIQLVLRYSVPVFLNSTENPKATLQWQVISNPKGKGSILKVHNIGAVRAQLGRIWVDLGKEKKAIDISQGLLGYVLPGKTLQRTIKANIQQLRSGAVIAVVNSHETQPKLEFITP